MSNTQTVNEAEAALGALTAKGEWTAEDQCEATELLLTILAAYRADRAALTAQLRRDVDELKENMNELKELRRDDTVSFTHDELVLLSDVIGRLASGVTETLWAFTGKPEFATALEKIESAKTASIRVAHDHSTATLDVEASEGRQSQN